MILGCIADDFTGAGDLASILTGQGMRTSLLTDPTDIAESVGDAVVVALKTRSIAPALAVEKSVAAVRALKSAGAQQIYFKYCSTFDSTPAGNIGPVTDALLRELRTDRTIICPAFPANGRTVYQGHLFVSDVLLNESGMRDHPVTPMSDSDIRRWLRRQSVNRVAHIPLQVVRQGQNAIAAALHDAGAALVVVDATCDEDLRAIGAAGAHCELITGGSALALALPDNFRTAGLIGTALRVQVTNEGAAIILAGSCSAATNRQVTSYRRAHPWFAVDALALVSGEPVLERADEFARSNAEHAPLIYSTITPADVVSGRHDPHFTAMSGAIEILMAELAVRAVARGVRRIVVAGGETSGAVIEALQPGEMTVGHDIALGVPMLWAGDVAYALKSGNFGGDDFFETALLKMEGQA